MTITPENRRQFEEWGCEKVRLDLHRCIDGGRLIDGRDNLIHFWKGFLLATLVEPDGLLLSFENTMGEAAGFGHTNSNVYRTLATCRTTLATNAAAH